MPTYAYRCTACSHEFDIFQKFSDAALTDCPECGSPLRKVFQPVGIVFKGSGWYVNDSRPAEKDTTAKADAGPSKDGKEGAAVARDNGGADSSKAPATSTTDAGKSAAPVTAKSAAD